MFRNLTVALLVSMPLVAGAQDPLQTDGDKYKLVLRNQRVRVLEYRDEPGDRTNRHIHRDFVLHALSDFKRRLTLADGRVMEREFKTGDTVWMEAQSHIGENIGSTATHVLIVELTELRPSATVK